MQNKYDVIIIGSGCSGLFCALNLEQNKKILIVSKTTLEENDSHLAQGGICVLRDEFDFNDFLNDTLKAGHNENSVDAVKEMISHSQEVIADLEKYNVVFEKEKGEFKYTREGAHSKPRILFHKDITGQEITSKLLIETKKRSNITMVENATLVDIICENNRAYGAFIEYNGEVKPVFAANVVLACGGVGGLYDNSTNYPILTGDALTICYKNHVELKDVNYVQIHPTSLYEETKGKRFLISESVRGEGALLYDKNHERFIKETLARDVVANKIFEIMKRDNTKHVWLDMRVLGKEEIMNHFPNIYRACMDRGIDPLVDLVPVVPAQHYYMGGIKVDLNSHTTMDNLFAVGECACNGVHGRNRLASNSLLESLVFAKKAAQFINDDDTRCTKIDCKYYPQELEYAKKDVIQFVKGEKKYEFS